MVVHPRRVVAGLQSAYASVVADVRERYDVTPTSYGSIGISGMMHGYLAFDAHGKLLAPSARGATRIRAVPPTN